MFTPFTGYDQTAQFYGKSKNFFYKTFISATPEVLESLGFLGTDMSEPSQVTVQGLHQFDIDTYSKNSSVTLLSELRWKLFSQTQKVLKIYPQLKTTCTAKILRSHYLTYLQIRDLLPVVCKPNPTFYERYYDEGKLLPVTSINKLPATTNMMSLTICSCKSACN